MSIEGLGGTRYYWWPKDSRYQHPPPAGVSFCRALGFTRRRADPRWRFDLGFL